MTKSILTQACHPQLIYSKIKHINETNIKIIIINLKKYLYSGLVNISCLRTQLKATQPIPIKSLMHKDLIHNFTNRNCVQSSVFYVQSF